MNQSLKVHIEYVLCIKITKIQSISGGDISQAFLLETDTERFFCKVNRNRNAFAMFLAENEGLDAISKTKTIATPAVLLCEALENGAFLVMEFIEPKRPSVKDMELLGHKLSALHQLSDSKSFGWETDNYIGSLAQRNTRNTDWATFYAWQRLAPQMQLALRSGKLAVSEITSEERLLKVCERFFPKQIEPALLHGDLWSGNYLIATDGTPFLIDPAIYYGHSEVDMGMTKLFGGFDVSFYRAYEELTPKMSGEKERTDLYQLYYLLVHLNLFGNSYKSQVMAIFNTYF